VLKYNKWFELKLYSTTQRN